LIWSVDIVDGVQTQLLGIGIWVSVALVAWRSRSLDHDPFRAAVALAAFVAVALLGARIGGVMIGQVPPASFFDPNHAGLTSSGGAVSVSLAALVLVSWGRSGRTLLDDLTPGMWLILAVSRMGCVFQGCDFGQAARWGIAYRMPSSAWSSQLLSGQISASATSSLPTFPFPLFDGLAAMIALVVAWRSFKRPLTSTLASAMVYLTSRFVLEFGRDPQTTEMWGVFTRPQVILCMVAFGCFMGLRLIARTSDDSLSN
jgi:prolipoprotein diacylglyceryltransferase